jgi:hypothetical protein
MTEGLAHPWRAEDIDANAPGKLQSRCTDKSIQSRVVQTDRCTSWHRINRQHAADQLERAAAVKVAKSGSHQVYLSHQFAVEADRKVLVAKKGLKLASPAAQMIASNGATASKSCSNDSLDVMSA